MRYPQMVNTGPVHVFAASDLPADAPVLLPSGGVDSWKMDVHGILVLAAAVAGVRVVAFEIAGTGESAVPMTPGGGAEIVRGLITQARTLGNGIVGNALGFDQRPGAEELGPALGARAAAIQRSTSSRHRDRATTKLPEAIGLMFSWLQRILEPIGAKSIS